MIEDFGFLEDRSQEYEFGEAWAEERVRFMAADRQSAGGEHYWWGGAGLWGLWQEAASLPTGAANTTAELEEIRRLYNVQGGKCGY